MSPERVRSFRDLDVWAEGVELVVECYRLTDSFPLSERYGLAGQIRRCAISIPSNVAEGHNRKMPRVYLNHVNIALGSEAELETHLVISVRLRFCSEDQVLRIHARRTRVGRMLHGLAASLRRRIAVEGRAALSASCVLL